MTGMYVDGLRLAKRLIADQRKQMATDPATRRSGDPYDRGYRQALIDLDNQIKNEINKIAENA